MNSTLKSIDDLSALRQQTLAQLGVRFDNRNDTDEGIFHIMVCAGTGCTATQSQMVIKKL